MSPIDVPRRPGLTRDVFEREHLRRGAPVIVPIAGAEWLAQLQPPALKSSFGDVLVDAEETREVYVGERTYGAVPLAELVDATLADDPTRRWKGLDFLARVPGMRQLLRRSPPPYYELMPAGAHGHQSTLWIAPPRTMSSLHHDGNYDNLNLQVSGRKVFLLAPPGSHREVYRQGTAESPVNPFAPDLARFPAFARVRVEKATLAPGEVLLVPKYWWHCVYAVEPSVNLATFFAWPGERTPWDAQRGVPLVHRTLTSVSATLKRRGHRRLADAGRRAWLLANQALVARVEPQPRLPLD